MPKELPTLALIDIIFATLSSTQTTYCVFSDHWLECFWYLTVKAGCDSTSIQSGVFVCIL